MSAPNKKANLFLTGMMGTGKTTIGKRIAQQLGYRFLDTDQMIEKESGLTIKEIFQEQGEITFREREQQLLSEIASDDRQVIASGGGMLLPRENLELAQANGFVVLLQAPVEVLARRVSSNRNRPLLEGHDTAMRLTELLKAREPFYSTIGNRVDTGSNSVDFLTKKIISLYNRWLAS